MNDFWDDDIAALDLSDIEKNGLQVYRNDTKAFNEHAEKLFAEEVHSEPFDLGRLENLLSQIAVEDVRFLPVIVCAYTDDLLDEMYKSTVPDGVPGGKSAMFSAYGPLSTLFNRIQMAFVFDMLSHDLLNDLNRIRKIRNDMSHSWDINKFKDYFTDEGISKIFPTDMLLTNGLYAREDFPDHIEPLPAFRIKLAWLMARLTYEAPLYARAKLKRLDPNSAIYGPNHPSRLSKISRLALQTSKQVVQSS